MSLKATDLLDVSITSAFLNGTMKMWMSDYSSQTSHKKYQPLSVRNQTTKRIAYQFTDMVIVIGSIDHLQSPRLSQRN